MCQNAVIWYFIEKDRDMDLCSTFTTGFEWKICNSLYMSSLSKIDDFSTLKLRHAKTAYLTAK
jgi:hypothetical protein